MYGQLFAAINYSGRCNNMSHYRIPIRTPMGEFPGQMVKRYHHTGIVIAHQNFTDGNNWQMDPGISSRMEHQEFRTIDSGNLMRPLSGFAGRVSQDWQASIEGTTKLRPLPAMLAGEQSAVEGCATSSLRSIYLTADYIEIVSKLQLESAANPDAHKDGNACPFSKRNVRAVDMSGLMFFTIVIGFIEHRCTPFAPLPAKLAGAAVCCVF
jgi:hypothetical protein